MSKEKSWIQSTFRSDYKIGQEAAIAIKSYLEKNQCTVFVLNHEAHTADLAVIRQGEIFTIEIKSHAGGYPKFPAEIYAHNKLAEYLEPNAATYVVQIDRKTKTAYWFVQSTLRDYILARLDERKEWSTGSEGILIDWTNSNAGFWRKSKVNI